MSYKIKAHFTDNTSCIIDTVYATREEAELKFEYWFCVDCENSIINVDPTIDELEVIEVKDSEKGEGK